MKILFYHGSYPFCYYYRGYLPGIHSKQKVVSDFMRKDMKAEQDLTKMALDSDVIVFQRPSDPKLLELARLLKAKGKKIIFENDDSYEGVPLERLENEKQKQIARETSDNLRKFLEFADGAIASTDTLHNEFLKYNPNVVTLKNCIDPSDKFTCKQNTTGKFRIGFIGSVTTNDDYKHIKDDIRKLDELGCTIVVMGVKYKDGTHLPIMNEDYEFWNSLKNVEWHPYCHITEYMYKVSQLALDVAIIPRLNHYFNLCKSNLKFLEMSLLKIPIVAEGILTYEQDADYMTLVYSPDSWYNTIVEVKNNYKKYKDLAESAHNYVLENYNIKNYAQTWVKQIENLCTFQQNT